MHWKMFRKFVVRRNNHFGLYDQPCCSRLHGKRRNNDHPELPSDIHHTLNATLEELHNGAVKKVVIQKTSLCEACIGTGTEEHYYRCTRCSGGGLEVHRVGQKQINRQCQMCEGHGQINRCQRCNGKMFARDRPFSLEVDIEQGMIDGHKTVFRGEGNQKLNMEYGDLIITINELGHSTFKRDGNDLWMTLKLDFTESLCGFQKLIKTLDNQHVIVKSEPGKVYSGGVIQQIMHKGMPVYRSETKGRLIIVFGDARLPKKIPFKHIPLIEKILPHREKLPANIMDAEEVNMIDMDTEETEEYLLNQRDAMSEEENDGEQYENYIFDPQQHQHQQQQHQQQQHQQQDYQRQQNQQQQQEYQQYYQGDQYGAGPSHREYFSPEYHRFN